MYPMTNIRIILFAAIVLAVLGSGTGFIHPSQATSGPYATTGNMQFPDYVSLFSMTQNSVVQITSTVSDPSEITIINGVQSNGNTTMLGSGFVYDTAGHIITNAHVVGQSKVVAVTLTDGNTYNANVVGIDPYNDLAVIQLTGNFTGESLVPLQLGNSSQLEVGQYVAAIGNPFGLEDTMLMV
jgi:S1-C subfamily serine protease